MSKSISIPTVNVAVCLLAQGEKLALPWNANWGGFTTPMTKRRSWRDPNLPNADREEEWEDAAARAGAEVLGRTCEPHFVMDLGGEFQQSDRDGVWKRYHYQVFRLDLPKGEPVGTSPGTIVEWLSPVEVLEKRPITQSARMIVGRLIEAGKL